MTGLGMLVCCLFVCCFICDVSCRLTTSRLSRRSYRAIQRFWRAKVATRPAGPFFRKQLLERIVVETGHRTTATLIIHSSILLYNHTSIIQPQPQPHNINNNSNNNHNSMTTEGSEINPHSFSNLYERPAILGKALELRWFHHDRHDDPTMANKDKDKTDHVTRMPFLRRTLS